MAFGQQSGPAASTKQVEYLAALLNKAGYEDFREARKAFGLTQRQSSGKFTRSEASTLIDRLVNGDGSANDGQLSFEQTAAAARIDDERARVLSGAPADLLADELLRRGWTVVAPDVQPIQRSGFG